MKAIELELKEVISVPEASIEIKINLEGGGYWQFFAQPTITGFALFVSDGSDLPLFYRVEHKFQTIMEAVFYAQYFTLKQKEFERI